MQSSVAKNSTTRQKYGGRKKGTPNKSTDFIFNLCAEKNFDPIEFLIVVATNDWKALGYDGPQIEKQGFQGVMYLEDRISMDHRIDAAKSLVGYMYPKRKSVEIKSDDSNKGFFTLNYSDAKLRDEQDK